MRQLDRRGINLFFAYTAYMPLFLIVSEIYGRKVSNGEKFEIFSNFLAHPVETPWPISTVLHQNVRMSVPYILDYIWHRILLLLFNFYFSQLSFLFLLSVMKCGRICRALYYFNLCGCI